MTILEIFLTSKASSANFNFKLNGYPTTYNDLGYETFFKVDEIQTKVSGETNHRASLYNCTMKTLIDYDDSSTFGNIIYKVSNYDNREHNISIATTANLDNYRLNYKKITELNENKGIYIQSTQNFYYLLEEIGSGKASTIWLGDSKDRFKNLYSNNRQINNDNPGIAFSWKDKVIKPNETKIFTIAMSLTQNTDDNITPRIEASILSSGPYFKGFFDDPNHNDNITIQVQINDINRKYKIKCNFNNVGPVTMKEVDLNTAETIHTFNFTLKTNTYLFNGTNRMTIYCQDSNGKVSNFVDFDIEAIIEPIKMNISIAERDSPYVCAKDDKFALSGWLNDFSGFGPVQIVALYNGNYEHVLKTYNDRFKEINDQVQIEANGLTEINNVSIFARNQCSGVSQMFNFKFGYSCRKLILNINATYECPHLTIKGSISYNESKKSEKFNICYYYDDEVHKTPECSSTKNNFFEMKFIPQVPDGEIKMYFYAQDSTGVKSDIISKEFIIQRSVPILSEVSEIQNKLTNTSIINIKGKLKYKSDCTIYYIIDGAGSEQLGDVEVVTGIQFGSFRFRFSLNKTLANGPHNLTLYAQSKEDQNIKSDSITRKFDYYSDASMLISKPPTINYEYFYYYHQFITKKKVQKKD